MSVRLILHNGKKTTAEVLAANEHGATLQCLFDEGFITMQVGPDGKAWGSNVHVADEDVPKLREKP